MRAKATTLVHWKNDCGHFSDRSFVSSGKRRGFCRLRSVSQTDGLLVA
jgi:hypothetical protein